MDGKQETIGPVALKRAAFVILAWAASYTLALQILKRHPASVWVRGGAVTLAILGFLLWLSGTARAIRAGNEFTRQIHLVALACAFATTGLFVFACDTLQRAGFIDYVSLMTLFLVMMGAWLLAVALATLYYR